MTRKHGRVDSPSNTRQSMPPFSHHVRKALSVRRDCKNKGKGKRCMGTTMTVDGWCVRCKQEWGFERAQEQRALKKKLAEEKNV